MPTCLISLGANLGSPRDALDDAVRRLADDSDFRGVVESQRLASSAVGGPPDQPAFVNSAVRFETALSPRETLAKLQAIEALHGRDRAERWAPRTLDLDLLACGDRVVREPTLRLPHPRMTFRPFVLGPAAEIAPDWPHPEIGGTLGGLWDCLRGGDDRIVVVGRSVSDRLAPIAVAQLLAAEFPGRLRPATRGEVVEIVVGEAVGSGRGVPKLTVDLAADGHAPPPVRGPRIRVADCDAGRLRDELVAAVACVWPAIAGTAA